MKSKIVIWGNDENEKKILIAVELKAKENKIIIYTFKEEEATEVFYNLMMNDWRSGNPVKFPDTFTSIERPLSMTEDLLPENIKVDRTDIITRAKAEWHFVVLSSKLHELYQSELDDLREKVDQLSEYENSIWEEMKGFWTKVQNQMREKNLFKEHADALKEQTNEVFSTLKELKNTARKEFKEKSREQARSFGEKLDTIYEKIEKGLGLKPIFEELKDIQREFNQGNFTREDRSKVWKRLDGAFKAVKEKKFGPQSESGSSMSRLDRRYNGLIHAIQKMENSIKKDKRDIEFESRKINESDGQLESQIRQAKIKMIEERVHSKQEKLDEMLQTKTELEKRKEVEAKKQQKLEEKRKIAEAEDEVKEKMATDMEEKARELEGQKEKLESAADSIKASMSGTKDDEQKNETGDKEKDSSLLSAATSVVGEAVSNVVDTVKAVAEVVEDRIEETIDEVMGKSEEE